MSVMPEANVDPAASRADAKPGPVETGNVGPSRRAAAAKVLVLLAGLALLIYLGRQLGAYVPRFATWVDGFGFWAPVVYGIGYAVATVAFIPGSILTLAAGALFGLARGTATVFLGASVGAALAFLVGRYAARGFVEGRIEANPRFQNIDRAIGRQGLKIALLLRLSPVFPFNLLNYALGLTRVRFRDYLIACLGMLPGTFLYVYYGKALGSVAAAAAGAGPDRGPGYWAVLGLGLAATVAVTTVVTRIARRALKEEVKDG
jgi:uncharacterized membrane protein YdjX (TVP38/TMEM64 family)